MLPTRLKLRCLDPHIKVSGRRVGWGMAHFVGFRARHTHVAFTAALAVVTASGHIGTKDAKDIGCCYLMVRRGV